MKRQTRKSGRKKLPMLWDESMDFEVAITPLSNATADALADEKIIVLPLSSLGLGIKVPRNPPPPLAA